MNFRCAQNYMLIVVLLQIIKQSKCIVLINEAFASGEDNKNKSGTIMNDTIS
jgi:hypothetical protein